MNLAGLLHHKTRSACGEIIPVRQILAELWSLTLRIFTRIFTHFSLSSQLLLHPCRDLNETWQEFYATSLNMLGDYLGDRNFIFSFTDFIF